MSASFVKCSMLKCLRKRNVLSCLQLGLKSKKLDRGRGQKLFLDVCRGVGDLGSSDVAVCLSS